MKITNLQTQQINYKANLNSSKLRFTPHDFFIKIDGYGKDNTWAKKIISTADTAVRMIHKNCDIENILHLITFGVIDANNSHNSDFAKKLKTGILRTARLSWICLPDKEIITPYNTGRYSINKIELNKKLKKPLQTPNEKLGISRPSEQNTIIHGDPQKINFALDYIFKLYTDNIKPYTNGCLKNKDLEKINNTIAEIRWVLAHATPWMRGSDAISNVLMKALYKSVGVKSYPPKKNISFDLQAYCTELEDYKKNFPKYFTKPPVVVE